MATQRIETEVDGVRLSLSNLDKVLFPATGFTKGALVDYYARVAPSMLTHVADRPVTFRRFPEGVDGESFFEKHVPRHAPSWVRTVAVPHGYSSRSAAKGNDDIIYAVADDRATLVWAANLATIEFHVPLWHIGDGGVRPGHPDHLVFDLDPGPGTTIVECSRVAKWITELLERESLGPAFPKTSGSKGLQLYVRWPEQTTWDVARDRALQFAQSIERDHGDLVVSNMRKNLRDAHVLIDWSQNHPAKTTVAAYSVRGREEPTVSTPVTLSEVEACARSGDPNDLVFRTDDVLARVAEHGDLMAGLFASSKPKPARPSRPNRGAPA